MSQVQGSVMMLLKCERDHLNQGLVCGTMVGQVIVNMDLMIGTDLID